jgi:hypothetical protein
MAPAAPKSAGLRNVVRIVVALVALGSAAYYFYEKAHTVTIGTKDQVIYSGTATKDQATALGNALKSDGYFTDQGVTVLLDKESSGTTISYVVKDGTWNQAGIVAKFDEVTREVASSVGGLPLNVQLVNTDKTVEKTSTVGSVAFGNDTVVYEGTATQADAQALGQKLQSLDYFSGKGADVFLGKHADGTAIAFVVSDGVWNDASAVTGFEGLVRDVAPAVGGLPIKMLLLSTTQQMEKNETITAQTDTSSTPANASSTVTIGTKDEVIYSGEATQDQATALGNALKQAGYFQDRGVTVLLSKGATGTVVSYVVQDGVWNNAAMVTDFETITKGVASSVGGLPIDMRLVNATEVVEKDVVVQ